MEHIEVTVFGGVLIVLAVFAYWRRKQHQLNKEREEVKGKPVKSEDFNRLVESHKRAGEVIMRSRPSITSRTPSRRSDEEIRRREESGVDPYQAIFGISTDSIPEPTFNHHGHLGSSFDFGRGDFGGSGAGGSYDSDSSSSSDAGSYDSGSSDSSSSD